jgi:hypothetical protein
MIGREYIKVKYDKEEYLSIKVRKQKTVGITLINSGVFILIKEAVEQVRLVKNIEPENY